MDKLCYDQEIDETGVLSCVIENAQNIQGHIEYDIKVTRAGAGDNSWRVTKRYNDFVILHGTLQNSNIDLPLPPKRVFGNMGREFVAERQAGLQNYLNIILNHPVLSTSIWIKRFLDPDNYSTNQLDVSLQFVSMLVRSESLWEVVENLPRIGWRAKKEFFVVRNKGNRKEKFFLSWVDLGPDRHSDIEGIQNTIKGLTTIKHPFIYPTTFATATENGGFVIQPLSLSGTLRDHICKAQLEHPFLKKYGNPKEISALSMMEIKKYGRQILEAVLFLQQKGFHYGHLHAGNIIVDEGVCKITDYANQLLGLSSYYRPFFIQVKKVQRMENINVYSFGHLMYEMAFGRPLLTPTCDVYPSSCPSTISSVLESILTTEACKCGLPSVSDLLTHPLFQDVSCTSSSERPYFKPSSQMKEVLKATGEKSELRLRDDQRALRQAKRVSKVQASLSSMDEKPKRKPVESKKSQVENGKDQKLVNTSTKVSQVSSVPAVAIPPPPPPPPSLQPLPAPPLPPSLPPSSAVVPESLPKVSEDRNAFLGSIQAFNKKGLRKAATNDRSIPTV